jgi:hypothetical protein
VTHARRVCALCSVARPCECGALGALGVQTVASFAGCVPLTKEWRRPRRDRRTYAGLAYVSLM